MIGNHFIPFTEVEVGSPKRFESNFMSELIKNLSLSDESTCLLNTGRELWCQYFSQTDPKNTRDELKLDRSDVGWYQIRKALARRNETGLGAPVDFKPFEQAYEELTAKLQPQVFELGFLRK